MKINEIISESQTNSASEVNEDLRKWFKEKWVRFGPDGKIRGDCARGDDSEGKPKCLPQAKAHALGKKGRKYAAAKKRREDPNPERSGPAKNVATKKKSNEDLAEGYGRYWCSTDKKWKQRQGPRQTRKTESVAEQELDEACWKGYHKEGMKTMFGKKYPNCVKNTNEEQELDEYGDTPKGQRMLTKVQKRSVDRMIKADDKRDAKGAKKNQDTANRAWERMTDKDLEEEKCPHCGGPMFSDLILAEKQDACYHKVKSRYKVWPSAYASGALVQCRKKGASNWGNKSKK